MAVLKVKTEIIASIAVSPTGRDVIMYVETFKLGLMFLLVRSKCV
jgi:hypothetical protein